MLCGGEAMPPDLADDLAGDLADGDAHLWNMYGPTETAIWSCVSRVVAGEPVVLGDPLPATSVRVVDQHLSPVPIGTCGELLIGGTGVAAGYLNRPGLTAARFLPDPDGSGRTLYRTGDVVRRCADDTLEFVGRTDQQVKVRGHRIELGDIEAALRGAAGVLDAVATVQGAGQDARIVGHVVVASTVEPDAAWVLGVRAHVAGLLPAGWVPAEYVRITAVPLTANGKVDRGRLAGTRLAAATERVAARTPLEETVGALWCELLGLDEVGVTDDFFLLGGHSLLVARLVERVERELGVRVPITEIFVEPTVARIAATVEQRRGGVASSPARTPARPPAPDDADWDFDAVAAR